MIKISPSVLASDFSRLGQELKAMERAGADMIHLDVMDGRFVPNISFGPPVIRRLRQAASLPFDTHLMIERPGQYLKAFAEAGSDLLTFHAESQGDPAALIDEIHGLGMQAGLVLKPGTPAEAAFPYLDRLEMVLVMTVEPGFGGQAFLEDMCPKIGALRREAARRGLSPDIQVDGGIDEATAPLAVRAGANVLVAGSSLFGKPDYREALASLRRAAEAAL